MPISYREGIIRVKLNRIELDTDLRKRISSASRIGRPIIGPGGIIVDPSRRSGIAIIIY